MDIVRELIESLHEDIYFEEKIIRQAHEIAHFIYSLDHVLGTLSLGYEDLPQEIDAILNNIHELIPDLQRTIDVEQNLVVSIEQEEKHIIDEIKDDARHHNWKAVLKDKKDAESVEKNARRLTKRELSNIHEALKKIVAETHALEELDFDHEAYCALLKVHHALKTYQHLFEKLIEKEEHALRILERN